LIGIARDAIFATAGWIYEFNFNSRSHAGQVTIEPAFKRIGRSRATALVRFTVVSSAGRVGFSLVRLSIHDVDAAAVRFPAGDAGGIVLVGVSDALVIFLAI